jgi:hypothetical protein
MVQARQQGATLRKWLSACVVGVLVGVFGVAGAAVAVPVLNVREVRAATADPVTAIDVEAYGDNDIVSVKATVRLYQSVEVLALLDAFELASGTARDGVWRSTGQVDLTDRNVQVTVHLTDASGYSKDVYGGAILNGLRPVFAEFGVTPDHVDVDHDDVTYRGRVVIRRDDGTEYGLEGLRVSVAVQSSSVTVVYTVTTGADGWFTGTFVSRVSVSVVARTWTTVTYVSVATEPVAVTGRLVPTRISIGVAPAPSPYYVVGEMVTVAGKLEGQNWSDEWYNLSGLTVRIYHHNSETGIVRLVTSATTGTDGTYSASVRVPGPGSWRVVYGLTSPYGWAYTEKSTDFLDARYRIELTGFNVSPEPVAKGGTVTARGTVLRTLANGTTTPATDGWVDLAFSTDKSIWTHVAQRAVGSTGAFSIPATATRDGYWRVAYHGGTNNLSGMTASDYVDTRYKTAISSFNAGPEPVRYGDTVTVSGKLSGYTTSWAPLGGRTVYVYFVPKGSTTATYLGTDGTDSSGVFRRSFTAKRDGYWYARYKGSATYLPVTTFRDYVDVA